MKIFVAGETGVIGRTLLPMLIKEGHLILRFKRGRIAGRGVLQIIKYV
ncbi:hypothetical protein Bmyc01_51360 [Bacillus mycoides]|nr:hypothetical protein Bmyc01_51360 [Bacillus mycoides]